MKEQGFFKFPPMLDLEAITEQNNIALKRMFKGKINGFFLINVKERVMKELGLDNFLKYYDFRWTDEKSITGIGTAAEYDICRTIVGIHRAQSIFLSEDDIRKNEKNKRYKQQLISETIEKIKLRLYGSAFFRQKTFIQGEEFIYYPLPYELFAMSVKMNQMLLDGHNCNC